MDRKLARAGKLRDLENKLLAFEFEILNIQFNHESKYFLKLTVQSSFHQNYSEDVVEVQRRRRRNDYVFDDENETDVLTQYELHTFYQFQHGVFTFILPKNFVKNDIKHDTYLKVEAFDVDSPDGHKRKVGEGIWAIFPRTNAPKVNLFAQFGEDFYKSTEIMTLLRTSSTQNLKMHCGRLKTAVRFYEYRKRPTSPDISPPPTRSTQRTTARTLSPDPTTARKPKPKPKPRTPSPPPREPTPPPKEPSPVPKLDLQLSPGSTFLVGDRKITESPLPPTDNSTYRSYPKAFHVAQPGQEEVTIIFHGAHNLPASQTGDVPLPYCAV